MLDGSKPKDTLARGSSDVRDAAFEMELLYGTLRHLAGLDWIARKFLKKPESLPPDTINNIRLGLYQIFHTRVPQFAAVNETVKLEYRVRGVVNAVLRGAIRDIEPIRAELAAIRASIGQGKANQAIALVTSHPLWLVNRWIARFGAEGALALCDANNMQPPLTLRVNNLKTNRHALLMRLEAMGIEAAPTLKSPVGITVKGEAPLATIKALIGEALVQDEGAQLVSLMLKPKKGQSILDACAAPGGKATHIAELIGDRGEVIAVDNDKGRMRRMKDNMAALGVRSLKPVLNDVMEYVNIADDESFDAILLDAPCTALGVIRRNPDVRYRHKEADLGRFAERQLAMLQAMVRLLKPSGRLVYATCSTEPEEGEHVTSEIIKRNAGCFMLEESRTYPHIDGMDGFYVGVIGKKTL